MYKLKSLVNSDLFLRQKRFQSICSGSLPNSSYYFDRLTNHIYEIKSDDIFNWRDNVIRDNFNDPNFLGSLTIDNFVKNIENRTLSNYFFQQTANQSLTTKFLKSTLENVFSIIENNNRLVSYYLDIFNTQKNAKVEKIDESVLLYYKQFEINKPIITILNNSINLNEDILNQTLNREDNFQFNKQVILENIDKQNFLDRTQPELNPLTSQKIVNVNNIETSISENLSAQVVTHINTIDSNNTNIENVDLNSQNNKDDFKNFNFNQTNSKTGNQIGNARIFFEHALKNIPTEYHHQFLKLYPLIEKIELIDSYHIETLEKDIQLIDELIASQLKTALISYQLSHLDISDEVNSLSIKIDNFLSSKSEEFLDILLEKEINHIELLRTNFRKIARI